MNIIQTAQDEIAKIQALADARQIMWTTCLVPFEHAGRAFSGAAKGYSVLVCQANVIGHGVIHEGVVVCNNSTVSIIKMTPEQADKLYHMAANERN